MEQYKKEMQICCVGLPAGAVSAHEGIFEPAAKDKGNLNQHFESEIDTSQRQSSLDPAAHGKAEYDALPAWQKVMKVQFF